MFVFKYSFMSYNKFEFFVYTQKSDIAIFEIGD